MTREEIVEKIAEKADLTKKKAADVLKATLESITEALKKGDKVAFIGFGTFSVTKRAARTGINPQTKAKIKIPATKVPKFKAGLKLKEAVNNKKK